MVTAENYFLASCRCDHEQKRGLRVANAERKILKILEGDCDTAIGVYAKIDQDFINIKAELFSVDGKQRFFIDESEDKKMIEDLSTKIGQKLKSESKGSATGGFDNCISTILSLNFSVPYFIPYQTAPAATAKGKPNIIHSVVVSGEDTSVPDRRAGTIIVANRVPIPETTRPKYAKPSILCSDFLLR